MDGIMGDMNGAWFNQSSQASYVRGREAWGVSLDAVLALCLEQFIGLRRRLILKLEALFNELWQPLRKPPKAGQKRGFGGSFHDFQMLLFTVDPTLLDGVVLRIYEQCVEKTAQDAGVVLEMGAAAAIGDDASSGVARTQCPPTSKHVSACPPTSENGE